MENRTRNRVSGFHDSSKKSGRRELGFRYSAHRAGIIFGQILKGRSGCDIVIRITFCGIVFIATDIAHVFHENLLLKWMKAKRKSVSPEMVILVDKLFLLNLEVEKGIGPDLISQNNGNKNDDNNQHD